MFLWHFKFHHHLAEPAFSVFVFLIKMFFKRWSCPLSTSVLLGCFFLLFAATHWLFLLFFLVPSRIPIAITHVCSGRNFLSTDSADVNILTDLCRMHVGDVSPDVTKYPPTPGTHHWLCFLPSMCRVHVLQQTIVRLLISQSCTLFNWKNIKANINDMTLS